MTTAIEQNKAWIESGAIGCVFASALIKHHHKIDWNFFKMELTESIPVNNYYHGKSRRPLYRLRKRT